MRDVLRGSAINLVGGAVTGLATFVLAFALTRTLSAADVGVFYASTSLFLLVTALGQLGTSTGLVYFIARDDAASGGQRRAAYVLVAARPVLVIALGTSALIAIFAPQLSALLSNGGSGLTLPLRLVSGFVVFAAVLNLCTSASRGLGTMTPTALFDQTIRPVLQIGLVLWAVPTGDIGLVVLGWALPYMPCALASLRWWRRHGAPIRESGSAARASSTVGREFWRFTAPRALAGVAQMAMQRLDILLVGAMAGLAEAAIYTVATRFHVVGQLPGMALSRATQSRLAAALMDPDRTEARRLYQVATCWLVLAVWPFYLTLVLASDHLLRIFGADYVEGAGALVLLSLTMLVATGCGMVDNVLTMGGRTSWNLYNVLVALTVNLGLDLLLIPDLGLMGAAIGWSAAILCANLIPLAQIAFAMRLHPFGAGTLTAMVLALLWFGALPGLVTVSFGLGPWVAIAAWLVAVAGYLASAWPLRSTLHIEIPSRTGRTTS
nr:oligosaccharide flippase family protein [Nocardioides daedukensis]